MVAMGLVATHSYTPVSLWVDLKMVSSCLPSWWEISLILSSVASSGLRSKTHCWKSMKLSNCVGIKLLGKSYLSSM